MSEYVHTIEPAAHRWWAWEGRTPRTTIRVATARSPQARAVEIH
jgi:hypothetical protein